MRYGSICSGIEAATCAWHQLGWTPAWFAEIEPFPSAVLAHHYPEVPNLGDMTKLAERILAGEVEAPDLLVGGTPCQAFSVAGLRKGLADDRGKLTPAFALLADAIDEVRAAEGKPPVIIVWENVPGVLSDKDNAYGCFLGLLAGEDIELQPPGGRWTNAGLVLGPTRQVAWRVLDAQYFGVAQRRKRVFVVASARGNGVYPAQVLFVEQGVRRDSPPRREAWQGTAAAARGGAALGGGQARHGDLAGDGGGGGVAYTFRADAMREGTAKTPSADAEGRVRLRDPGMGMYEEVAPTLDCGQPHGVAQPAIAFDTTQLTNPHNQKLTGDQDPVVLQAIPVLSFKPGQSEAAGGVFITEEFASTLQAQNNGSTATPAVLQAMAVRRLTPVELPLAYANPAIAFTTRGRADGLSVESQEDLAYALKNPGAGGRSNDRMIATPMAVRRLTPTECERLQGFPDDYTAIPWRNKTSSECPDGPRYKALGNSMAVPVMRWLGNRINNRSQP